MKIFLHASLRHLRNLPQARHIIERLRSLTQGTPLAVSAHIADETRLYCPDCVAVDPGATPGADLAVSLGGDGTFIRTAQCIGADPTPILGINAGHLGYLADFTPEDFLHTDISTLQYEQRMMLRVDSPSLPAPAHALNEVALLKTDTASMIEVEATLGGNPLTTYRADGLLIATPTGSTAYNISVGGPIVDPSLRAVILSPVAPHSLTMRPLVVAPDAPISLQATSRSGQILLSVDGQSAVISSPSQCVITAAPHSLTVALRPGHHFADTLRAKLLWGK